MLAGSAPCARPANKTMTSKIITHLSAAALLVSAVQAQEKIELKDDRQKASYAIGYGRFLGDDERFSHGKTGVPPNSCGKCGGKWLKVKLKSTGGPILHYALKQPLVGELCRGNS